ncbi:winged helix-turn-helix transcriptional regulator [Paenibacillus sp. 7124]|uniref:Winged helix-turn-helix transcriptional regulator n=1 Tax=Paenibacillus apii TaxID=1850370 RepID=A0A6M1PK79_9BACL|nr:winged helix-turn-helix domain-containing protein [Paenibacillus apii]NGM82722.1 winged helix-turn-helix transcriptional regulator [Paenibacillus apii]NJJ39863.1 winged helix-turn-helix transcriptional regulator [Paenibacillus apii]
MVLEFNENGHTVSAEDITVELFAKEFALLRFLYRNRGRVFSREQLLDNVWPLEYPVERTVDDHIYRLRKKLGPFEGLTIRTVRGFGYCLTVREQAPGIDASPSVQDVELREKMREVFVKYHQYGQGKSMLALARQQDILGYELDPFYSAYVRFVQGDLEWLLTGGDIPDFERAYWLLLFFIITGEPKDSLNYCEQVLAAGLLPPSQHRELEILNILDLYALTGAPEKALERLKLTRRVIAEPGYENFETPVSTAEMFVHLMKGTPDGEMQRMAEAIEGLLKTKPFLREIGCYTIIKGLWMLRKNERRMGESLLDEGLRVLDLSGFVPIRLFGLYHIAHFCRQFAFKGEEAVLRKYEALFAEEQERCGLPGLMGRIEEALNDCLRTERQG